jgi:small subunit ribosomal protein S11
MVKNTSSTGASSAKSGKTRASGRAAGQRGRGLGSGGSKTKILQGIVHIQATFNNTIVSVCSLNGDVIANASAGSCGFKGARKSTPFAAQQAAESAVKQSMDQGIRKVEILVSGPGSGRELALRAIQATGVNITLIRDVTPVPHNGCRPPKKRRV